MSYFSAAKNKLFKNIKYESTQEKNLFFYSYYRILVSLAQAALQTRTKRQTSAVGDIKYECTQE